MDYGKSGNPKVGKHEPHNKERSKGLKDAANARPSKAELLAKMKAALEAKKTAE